MASKLPYYQRYPKDYLTDENVAMMTLEEEGAYNRLMDHCWLEGSIPDDLERLARLCRTSADHMARLWPAVRPCFEEAGEGRLDHPRLRKERSKARKKHDGLSRAGHKGAAARWKRRPMARKPGTEDKSSKDNAIDTMAGLSGGHRPGDGHPMAFSDPDPDPDPDLEPDQKRTSYARAHEDCGNVENSPPPDEERGGKNGTVKSRPRGTDLITPPARSELAWYGDEDRWRKVERAVRILWTNPTACHQMLVEACTVPKARRDRVNESADDTLARRRNGDLDLTIARRDLIAAIKGSIRPSTAGRDT